MRAPAAVLMTASLLLFPLRAMAQDEAAPAVAEGATGEAAGAPPAAATAATTMDVKQPVHYPSWSYAFDLRAATMASKFTPLLAAHWNKIFRSTDTEIGIAGAGMPQTVKVVDDDGKREYVQYSYGVDVAQAFLSNDDYRAGAGLVLGQGVGFVRTTPKAGKTRFKGVNYKLIEPSVYFTFFSWRSMDIGVSASMRIALANDAADLKTKDVSSVTFGATFRERRSH